MEIYEPKGFKTTSKNIGIKEVDLDFTVIQSIIPATAAAVFTKNRFCSAPVQIGKQNIENNILQAFVINSGNSNVATGEQGLKNAKKIIEVLSKELNISATDILPSSTGVIGYQLPMEKILYGIANLKDEMVDGGFHTAAKAILTTDTKCKIQSCKIGDATLLGIAKGSGMIEPNMATMLCYFVTDAHIPQDSIYKILKGAVDLSFNMISVDTDTSTSDTVAIMANGLAGTVDLQQFEQSLKSMAIELAKEIARDGEGATKLIEVNVNEASDFLQAKKVAKSIVNSPLVKTAIFGTDPNWGRIAMAIGKTEDPSIDPAKISIAFNNLIVFKDGQQHETLDLLKLRSYLGLKDININVSLGLGNAHATVWGCDLTYDYVKINGEYTS
ncbi:bifunctional glutamate N-acetyltransferase/amino-acid acetyltransferase ArgJ [Neobacillus ginsengisoli]|uniref:Arginine biosynthesis bifunctional protein ArgJ n=1 Tax=Neobacillus ginsengisoli TaxID=904295 RepID=A0ABT9XWF2_9BACI|nr:bifunctional glutamate N-acetyltransferase/amino-acid acetyltransferase ArgJ [Neobacillus ginsengisoli]MDQ0199708.1 glutamate N-acetyltransferase/amino-acid N-acetyltransferase [Neobacillus ginsengisoli]